jgi:endo-1,4-beta-xylanase
MFHHKSIFTVDRIRHRVHIIWLLLLIAGLTCSPAMLAPHRASAQTGAIIQNDFEDGTLQGWIPRGSTVLTNTTESANTGTHSLKTAGRTAEWNGPSLDLFGKFLKGATYQIDASVRLVAGQPAGLIRVTMQRTLADGTNQFDQVSASAMNGVTDAAWVRLQGQYSFSNDITGLLLYIESSDPTTEYYVDDFNITLLAGPPGGPQDNSGLATDFETGASEGWGPRLGYESVTVTSADKHGGNYSILTTGRQQWYDGASIDVTNKMYNGSRYRVSVWVKLAPGEAPVNVMVSLQRNLGSTTTFHNVVGGTTVTADQWVLLSNIYNYNLSHSSLTLYLETASVTPARTPSFYIDDFSLTYLAPLEIEPDIPSVYQTYAGYFRMGAAIEPTETTGVHAELLKKHFNSITAGNAMKPGPIQPIEGMFNFGPADTIVNFARANGIGVRGHTLVWHSQNPSWLFLDASGNPLQPSPESKALMLKRLEDHIRAVVSRYRDDVYAWDVVNEVIDEGQPDGLRRTDWYRLTGTDYIETAFRVAREVAPNAKLYINDYNTTIPNKRTALYNLVRDMRARGVPIDGVGHQMHSNIDFPSVDSMVQTVNMFAELGVDQQVTEFDMSVYTNSTDRYSEVPEEILIRQGYRYRDIWEAYKQLKDKISSVTVWGLADDNTWLKTFPIPRLDLPLLFDESLKAKHAYWGIIDPLRLPGADISTSLSADSSNVVNGRDVSYTITVTNHGRNQAANVSMVDMIPAGMLFRALAVPTGWTCNTPLADSTGQVTCTTDSMEIDASAQFILTLAVTCAAPDGMEIVNSATATSVTRDPNLAPNNSAAVSVRVSNTPPVIRYFLVNKPVLFPLNHRMVDVKLIYDIDDCCDTGLVPTITISSNQPTSDGGSPDWEVVDAHQIRLRAEISPGCQPFRVYTIKLTVTDSSGAKSSRSVNVIVIPIL